MSQVSRSSLRIFVLTAAMLSILFVARAEQSLVDKRAPDFSRSDLQNARIDLAQYRGKVVLLNFWATWCGPCRLEMPRFVQWQKAYGPQGLQVLGVSIDDSVAPVRPFVQKLQVNYPIMMGDAQLGDLYGGVYGVPVTFLIDRKGIIRARYDGEPDLGALESEVQKMLSAH